MHRYRTAFISDVHLGSADCQADYLLDFLNQAQFDTLYLVGDIVDLIAMQRRVHFPDSHQAVIRKLQALVKDGVQVIYTPGNHDDFFRGFCGQQFAGITIEEKAVHTTADGRSFLVCHGDQFDQVVRCSPFMLLVGDRAHGFLLRMNRWFNAWRRFKGRPYWSLAGWIKARIGKAQAFIRRFELAALVAAERGHFDGFICGHIHSAGFRRGKHGLYCNDGDWVEHCTALVEDFQGQLSILHWSEHPSIIATEPAEVTHPGGLELPDLPRAFIDQINHCPLPAAEDVRTPRQA